MKKKIKLFNKTFETKKQHIIINKYPSYIDLFN